MLIVLASLARAADLETSLTTSSGEVKSMTFHHVEVSAPPPFEVQLNGEPVRVALTVARSEGAWVVSAEISEVDRRGREAASRVAETSAAPEKTAA